MAWNVNSDIEMVCEDGRERWYVARSLPHKEHAAKQRLIAQGFCTFLPMQDRTLRHARRIITVCRPVFPRYLFVRFNPMTTQWRSINGTVGLDRLIMRGDEPEPVRRGVVESLAASVDERDRLRFRQILRPGDRVRLMCGPFAEQLGVLGHLGPHDRVQVLLSFLGGPVPVQVDRTSVALAS
jgi:transcriptional antiterminator RfaH